MIWGGLPAQIIEAAEGNKISVVVSEEIVEEINRTLQYHRLREVYETAGVNLQQLTTLVLRIGKLVQVKSNVKVITDDASDNKIIDCALASGADFIVSGDKHLLTVKKYGSLRILSVSEFIKIIQ